MAYLNWKALPPAELKLDVKPGGNVPRYAGGPVPKTRLELGLTHSRRTELKVALQNTAVGRTPGAELRVDLPSNWILFFKTWPSGCRFLIAHPASGEWVSTLALDPLHTDALLGLLDEPETVVLGEALEAWGGPDRISNLEVDLQAL